MFLSHSLNLIRLSRWGWNRFDNAFTIEIHIIIGISVHFCVSSESDLTITQYSWNLNFRIILEVHWTEQFCANRKIKLFICGGQMESFIFWTVCWILEIVSPPRSSSVKICFLLAKVDLLLFISSNDCCKTRLTVVVMEFEYDEFSSENFELKN